MSDIESKYRDMHRHSDKQYLIKRMVYILESLKDSEALSSVIRTLIKDTLKAYKEHDHD